MPDESGSSPDPRRLPEVLAREYASLGRAVAAPASAADEASSLREIYKRVHQTGPPLSALCISGGGIRSATFALGALQELGRRGLLAQFDYLSTVSGGGYIGSWLSAWIHRAGGVAGVLPRLTASKTERAAQNGPDPVSHLREFNSYLTPKLGLGSVDTWTLAAIVVRNLLLNWLLLLPLLMAALMAPRVLVSVLQVRPPWGSDPFALFDTLQAVVMGAGLVLYCVASFNSFGALPSVGSRPLTEAQFVRRVLLPRVASSVLLIVGFWWVWDDFGRHPTLGELVVGGVALTFLGWLACLVAFDLPKDPKRFGHRLFGPLSLAAVVLGLCSGAAAYVLTHFLFDSAKNENDPSFYATFAPALFLIGLLLGQVLAAGFTSRTLGEPDREWAARSGAYELMAIGGWLLLCTVVLVVPHLAEEWGPRVHSALAAAGGLSAWITATLGRRSPPGPGPSTGGSTSRPLGLLRAMALPVFVILLMVGLTVLTNVALSVTGLVPVRFSAHHDLVERSSVAVTVGTTVLLAALAYLVGLFVNINTFSLHAMYRDRLTRAYLAASNRDRHPSPFTGFDYTDDLPMTALRGQRPLHVVNLALNLVATKNLAWQQRKAESMTVSPFDTGSRGLGYRDSELYGGPKGIWLSAAMTISGAAASPNMGYHSSPLVGFTMMLFNARLGSWLGNPGPAGRDTWRDSGPRSAVASVVREMLGLTDESGPYVYLSDGGHFENLALYEMVVRRCRSVVVLDDGCDPDFTYEDLGNALRKIRIDLGVPIEFEEVAERPLRNRTKRAAVARIRYSAVDETKKDGWLLYVKPMVLGSEPPDVLSYAAANATFPHESTSNQWFNEAQTESYRMLGEFTVAEICGDFTGALEDLPDHVARKYLGAPATKASGR
jgi:hypothetical protein